MTKSGMENITALAAAQQDDVELNFVCLEDIDMKAVTWLWPDRIARGKITLFAGNPGGGKSQTTAALAATITASRPWPDGLGHPDTGNVVILSAEDDAADTIKPRLVAAGANVSLCHVLEGVKTAREGRKTERTFDLAQDIQRLGEALEKIGNVQLVIIDPISAYMGKVDSHKDAEVRGMLAPLSAMADKHDVAVVLVAHLNKSTEQEMLLRVNGSVGLVAAARAVYGVVKDKENSDVRYFVPLKNNLGNDRDGFSFHIESVMLPGDIKTSKIVWDKAGINPKSALNPEGKNATNGAQDFLTELLRQGPVAATEVWEQAEAAGYGKAAIQKAAGSIGVKKTKVGMSGGWAWRLPEGDASQPS